MDGCDLAASPQLLDRPFAPRTVHIDAVDPYIVANSSLIIDPETGSRESSNMTQQLSMCDVA
jgi:hypothetical protein